MLSSFFATEHWIWSCPIRNTILKVIEKAYRQIFKEQLCISAFMYLHMSVNKCNIFLRVCLLTVLKAETICFLVSALKRNSVSIHWSWQRKRGRQFNRWDKHIYHFNQIPVTFYQKYFLQEVFSQTSSLTKDKTP